MPKIIKKEELDKFTALGLVPRKDIPKPIIVAPEKVDLTPIQKAIERLEKESIARDKMLLNTIQKEEDGNWSLHINRDTNYLIDKITAVSDKRTLTFSMQRDGNHRVSKVNVSGNK